MTRNASIDGAVLEPLGRVMWAAINLHRNVRDAITHIKGSRPTKEPFDLSLVAAITDLEHLTDTWLEDPDRDALLRWVKNEAKFAARKQDAIAHAIGYTYSEVDQLGSTSTKTGKHLAVELLGVADALTTASRTLPRGPYKLII